MILVVFLTFLKIFVTFLQSLHNEWKPFELGHSMAKQFENQLKINPKIKCSQHAIFINNSHMDFDYSIGKKSATIISIKKLYRAIQ